jgi:hypothetical protein
MAAKSTTPLGIFSGFRSSMERMAGLQQQQPSSSSYDPSLNLLPPLEDEPMPVPNRTQLNGLAQKLGLSSSLDSSQSLEQQWDDLVRDYDYRHVTWRSPEYLTSGGLGMVALWNGDVEEAKKHLDQLAKLPSTYVLSFINNPDLDVKTKAKVLEFLAQQYKFEMPQDIDLALIAGKANDQKLIEAVDAPYKIGTDLDLLSIDLDLIPLAEAYIRYISIPMSEGTNAEMFEDYDRDFDRMIQYLQRAFESGSRKILPYITQRMVDYFDKRIQPLLSKFPSSYLIANLMKIIRLAFDNLEFDIVADLRDKVLLPILQQPNLSSEFVDSVTREVTELTRHRSIDPYFNPQSPEYQDLLIYRDFRDYIRKERRYGGTKGAIEAFLKQVDSYDLPRNRVLDIYTMVLSEFNTSLSIETILSHVNEQEAVDLLVGVFNRYSEPGSAYIRDFYRETINILAWVNPALAIAAMIKIGLVEDTGQLVARLSRVDLSSVSVAIMLKTIIDYNAETVWKSLPEEALRINLSIIIPYLQATGRQELTQSLVQRQLIPSMAVSFIGLPQPVPPKFKHVLFRKPEERIIPALRWAMRYTMIDQIKHLVEDIVDEEYTLNTTDLELGISVGNFASSETLDFLFKDLIISKFDEDSIIPSLIVKRGDKKLIDAAIYHDPISLLDAATYYNNYPMVQYIISKIPEDLWYPGDEWVQGILEWLVKTDQFVIWTYIVDRIGEQFLDLESLVAPLIEYGKYNFYRYLYRKTASNTAAWDDIFKHWNSYIKDPATFPFKEFAKPLIPNSELSEDVLGLARL